MNVLALAATLYLLMALATALLIRRFDPKCPRGRAFWMALSWPLALLAGWIDRV